MSRITLLTDFGTADGYVATMKGVIAMIAPAVYIDDASHDIPHGDILSAALALRRYWRWYPAKTSHLVVVDPKVGSDRRPIAIVADGQFFVGPDNGVFSFVLKDAMVSEVFEIKVEDTASNTFHGRDVFAPAAARLAAGTAIEQLGTRITDPITISFASPVATETSVRGEIIHIDRFGNLISNIPAKLLKRNHAARIAGNEARVVKTYGDAAGDEVVALVNSDGLVEIAVRQDSAARRLKVERGAPIELV
jgi:S-adenosylmethionine hydrolase